MRSCFIVSETFIRNMWLDGVFLPDGCLWDMDIAGSIADTYRI